MADEDFNHLLDKVVANRLSNEDKQLLKDHLKAMAQNSERPPADRMAAFLLRAALEARDLHVAQ